MFLRAERKTKKTIKTIYVLGIVSIAVILASTTAYSLFIGPNATLALAQNDSHGETNGDSITKEGPTGDGDGETNDDAGSQH